MRVERLRAVQGKPKTNLFFGGISTAREIELLNERYDNITEGDIISYADISTAIGLDAKSNRFQSVVRTWRNRLFREKNVVLLAEDGDHFRVADPSQMVTVSASKAATGRRFIMRSAMIASAVDRSKLTDAEAKTCDHFRLLPARLRLAELVAPRELDG